MLEELLALGHAGAEYDAWLIRINDGEQFGSGFVAREPELEDPGAAGPQRRRQPVRVFESGAILLYLAEKFGGAFLPGRRRRRAPSACRGCSGRWARRPSSAAASATSTPTRRPRSNTPSIATRWRSSASSTCSTAASPRARTSRATTTRSPTWRSGPGTARWPRASSTEPASSCRCRSTRTSCAGPNEIAERPAVQRGRMVNRTWGQPASQLHERHDASDFDTQDPGQAVGRG